MKQFICGLVIGSICTLSIGSLANGVWDNISVLKNDINVVVNGETVTADNFVYNDTTYLPLRAVSTALGESVEYDEITNTAYIGERNDNTVIKSKNTPPQNLIERGEIILYDGVYYYDVSSVDYMLYSTYGVKPEMLSEPEDFTITNKNGETKTWKLLDVRGYGFYYIPYDIFIDEILPFVK